MLKELCVCEKYIITADCWQLTCMTGAKPTCVQFSEVDTGHKLNTVVRLSSYKKCWSTICLLLFWKCIFPLSISLFCVSARDRCAHCCQVWSSVIEGLVLCVLAWYAAFFLNKKKSHLYTQNFYLLILLWTHLKVRLVIVSCCDFSGIPLS